jgi:uncharacterized protein YqeY
MNTKLIERINSDFAEAYKAKDMDTKNFLGVLKTEVTKEDKTPDDTHIIAKIKSMIKNAEATNSLSESELIILNRYLPLQMSDSLLEDRIRFYISAEKIDSPSQMGRVMGFLKQNFDGQYDGKKASTLAKTILQ